MGEGSILYLQVNMAQTVDIVGFTNKGWPVWGKFSKTVLEYLQKK
jgi:hypothetical protein